jgi:hypothetical protein
VPQTALTARNKKYIYILYEHSAYNLNWETLMCKKCIIIPATDTRDPAELRVVVKEKKIHKMYVWEKRESRLQKFDKIFI